MKKFSIESFALPSKVAIALVGMMSLSIIGYGIRDIKLGCPVYAGLAVIILGLVYGIIAVLSLLNEKGYLDRTTTVYASKEGNTLPMSITVDCDIYPVIPFYLRLVGKEIEHRKMGSKVTLEKRDGNLHVDGVEVHRYFSPNQKDGKHIKGHELRKELRSKQVLNACVIDALFANQQMIPEDWKTGLTYFWGTIFYNPENHLCVEYLYWRFGRWRWRYRQLDEDWYYNSPAALCEFILP